LPQRSQPDALIHRLTVARLVQVRAAARAALELTIAHVAAGTVRPSAVAFQAVQQRLAWQREFVLPRCRMRPAINGSVSHRVGPGRRRPIGRRDLA